MQVPGVGLTGGQGVWTANDAKSRERHAPPLLAHLSRPFVDCVLQVVPLFSAQMLDLLIFCCILYIRPGVSTCQREVLSYTRSIAWLVCNTDVLLPYQTYTQ